ncbi:hypothetical protein [Bosea sp. (in: a-proteobacteria)]|uniref:hypothetical protein n=1 Tax=Bosea sp. (in: a-proteobacteria) TaxID=1871050 RepID=UPI003F6FE7D4
MTYSKAKQPIQTYPKVGSREGIKRQQLAQISYELISRRAVGSEAPDDVRLHILSANLPR